MLILRNKNSRLRINSMNTNGKRVLFYGIPELQKLLDRLPEISAHSPAGTFYFAVMAGLLTYPDFVLPSQILRFNGV